MGHRSMPDCSLSIHLDYFSTNPSITKLSDSGEEDWEYSTTVESFKVQCKGGFIEIENQSNCFLYKTFPHFYQKFQMLVKELHLNEIAEIANTFFQHSQFRLIHNIEAFKKKFISKCKEAEEMKIEKNCRWLGEFSPILSYKCIDLNKLHAPKIEGQSLVFFVEQRLLPYHVTVMLNINQATYEPLENS